MYLSKDNKALVEDAKLDLTEADISTLKLLYKIKHDILQKYLLIQSRMERMIFTKIHL